MRNDPGKEATRMTLKTIGDTLLGFVFVAGSTLAVGLTVALIFWIVGLSFGECPRCD